MTHPLEIAWSDDARLTEAQADVVDAIRDRAFDAIHTWSSSGGRAPDLCGPEGTRGSLVDLAHLLQDCGDAEDMSWVVDHLLRTFLTRFQDR